MGINSEELIDKFIVEIKQTESIENERIIKDSIEQLEQKKIESSSSKNGLVISFWLSHFRLSETINIESFKHSLE